MALPVTIERLLTKHQVNYQTLTLSGMEEANVRERFDSLRSLGAARSVIMTDDKGKLLVVFPCDSALNVNRLNQSLNRSLRAATDGELRNFYDKHSLSTMPAIPNLAGLPTVIDESLCELETVVLDSGDRSDIIELSGDELKKLIGDAKILPVSESIVALDKAVRDGVSEEQKIFKAIENFTTLRIQQRLEETLELPPLPETAKKIINLRVDPNADINDLSNIVEMDPSLAAQVVSWASSPYYSAPGKIKSIHDAIIRVLGFDMVLNLALGLSLGKTMSMPKDGPRGSASYWNQAVYTAAAVEGLVTAIPRKHRPSFGMSYLSGLLSNFGLLLMAEVFPPQYSQVCRHLEANSHLPHYYIEQMVLGVTREQLSAWLMGVWNMPEEVVTALRHQQNPEFADEHAEYAKLLFVASGLLQRHLPGYFNVCAPNEGAFDELTLDMTEAEVTMSNILASAVELDEIARQLAG